MNDYRTITIKDARELHELLYWWGRIAPPRLERTGQQQILDRWCMARLLRSQLPSLSFVYPLRIKEDENPDFLLEYGQKKRGVEVTEAVDPKEQAHWTCEAKSSDINSIIDAKLIDDEWTDGSRYPGLIERAIAKKRAHCSDMCSELLIYLNTHDYLFDEPEVRLDKISRVVKTDGRFREIWVLFDRHVLDLRRKQILHYTNL